MTPYLKALSVFVAQTFFTWKQSAQIIIGYLG